MRRIPPDPVGGWLLDGQRYQSEDAYLEALRRRGDRRARVMARISVERGELLTCPGVAAEAVGCAVERLAPGEVRALRRARAALRDG